MKVEPHDLHHEFPEHAGLIHRLKTSDAHFSRLFDAYHRANKDVQRLEADFEHADDFELEGLKKQRLLLKDQLYELLLEAAQQK